MTLTNLFVLSSYATLSGRLPGGASSRRLPGGACLVAYQEEQRPLPSRGELRDVRRGTARQACPAPATHSTRARCPMRRRCSAAGGLFGCSGLTPSQPVVWSETHLETDVPGSTRYEVGPRPASRPPSPAAAHARSQSPRGAQTAVRGTDPMRAFMHARHAAPPNSTTPARNSRIWSGPSSPSWATGPSGRWPTACAAFPSGSGFTPLREAWGGSLAKSAQTAAQASPQPSQSAPGRVGAQGHQGTAARRTSSPRAARQAPAPALAAGRPLALPGRPQPAPARHAQCQLRRLGLAGQPGVAARVGPGQPAAPAPRAQ
jgi:hypothetical protein